MLRLFAATEFNMTMNLMISVDRDSATDDQSISGRIDSRVDLPSGFRTLIT